ncbi:MAG: zinc-dependent metalloprotease [Bdellovibrionota bacterium]
MKKITTSVLSVATLAVLSTACVKIESLDPVKAISKSLNGEKKKKDNRITNSASTNEAITVGSHNMQVVSETLSKKNMLPISSARAKAILEDLPSTSEKAEAAPVEQIQGEENLLLGFPISLLGEQNVFGAVITKVSDKNSEELGGLKLTDLPPLHVRTMIGRFEDGSPALSLIGCANDCSERSQQGNLISLPIVGVDEEKGLLMVDMSALGQALDLISMLDPDGEYTGLKAVTSSTTEFDYDLTSLVFDIKTTMVAKDTAPENVEAAPKTEFSVRWYMKLASGFNPAFTVRAPTEGVGFFETTRSKDVKITRFSITQNGEKIKYFIKNVPEAYRPHFSGALNNWNAKFKELVGVEPLSYEFVEKSDPRHAKLIPGDIRYNIIEWDEDNKAGYGGLGPSVANQFTGETMSANVLIQGPNIIEMYTKWFALSGNIRALREAGQLAQANTIIKNFSQEANAKINSLKKDFSIKLGKKLAMRVNSQRPELEDPMIKNHFEVVPAGVTFESYMKGYFTEMLEHELGHNLGLRHNFKGNLGSTDSGDKGTVSRSIMEYLGRPFRHLNDIGIYDAMAISYGYAGEAPAHKNWFCTDEHQASGAKNIGTTSPECSKSDATSDPFTFWESRVRRTLDLVLDVNTASAPVWKTAEVKAQIEEFTIAFANYAAAAEKNGETWTNFFGKADRPDDKTKVKAYVLKKMKALVCDAKLADIIKAKESQEAQTLAQENLSALRKVVSDKSKELGVFSERETACN